MKPERWEQIKDLFGLALEREPSQRVAFLQEACSDEETRAEVESLLASHEMAESAEILLNPCRLLSRNLSQTVRPPSWDAASVPIR